MLEAKTFQEWKGLGGVKKGDVFVCVQAGSGWTYTKGKEYVVVTNGDGMLALTDNRHKGSVVSYCSTTTSTFIKKEEKKMRKMLKTNWSLEWSKENAAVIVKTLDALGIPVFEETLDNPVKSQSDFTYIGEARGTACGRSAKCCDHFKHLEDFLVWYFRPAKEIEIEALDAKIEELKAQVAKLKGVM